MPVQCGRSPNVSAGDPGSTCSGGSSDGLPVGIYLITVVVPLRSRVHHAYKGHLGGGSMDVELRLQLSEEGADAGRLAALTGYLRAELIQLDIEDVKPLPVGEAPPGARVFGAAAVGALLVAVGQSADALRSVVSLVSDWLGRGQGTGRAVRLEIGGDALELSQASTADQERLIELFVRKHSPGGTAP